MLPDLANQLLRLVSDPMVMVWAGGEIAGANPAFCRLLARSRDDLLGCRLAELVTDPKEKTFRLLRLFAGSGDWLVGGLSLRRENGSSVDFPCKGLTLQGGSGKEPPLIAIQMESNIRFGVLNRTIAELNQEIRHRRQLETELRLTQFAVDKSADPILWIRPNGAIQYVNDAACKKLGYSRGQLLKFSVPQIDPFFPADIWPDHWRSLKNQGSLNFETSHRTADGRLIPMEVTANYIEFAGQEYNCAFVRDISERIKTEEELRKHRDHLEELVAARTEGLEAANRELEAFLYSVAHDLPPPLRAIDGFSQMLAEKYEAQLDPEGQRLIKVVRNNTARMAQLIDDILAFSRAGRLELRRSRIDMEQLARAVWLDLEPLRVGRDIRMEIKPLALARGDPTLLRQVWINLLTNAIKFTQPRAVAHVEVGGMTEGSDYFYYVQDDGVGFDPAYTHKLFGVFQRLHGVDEFRGTGIGLATVKRIVARHGGRVMAEGRVGVGATFRFMLPTGEP